jgi:hypothetical protein
MRRVLMGGDYHCLLRDSIGSVYCSTEGLRRRVSAPIRKITGISKIHDWFVLETQTNLPIKIIFQQKPKTGSPEIIIQCFDEDILFKATISPRSLVSAKLKLIPMPPTYCIVMASRIG